MTEGEVKREYYCAALERSVAVVEVYGFHGSGACPVSSALTELHCDGESECRKRSLYQSCRLWDEYEQVPGI